MYGLGEGVGDKGNGKECVVGVAARWEEEDICADDGVYGLREEAGGSIFVGEGGGFGDTQC